MGTPTARRTQWERMRSDSSPRACCSACLSLRTWSSWPYEYCATCSPSKRGRKPTRQGRTPDQLDTAGAGCVQNATDQKGIWNKNSLHRCSRRLPKHGALKIPKGVARWRSRRSVAPSAGRHLRTSVLGAAKVSRSGRAMASGETQASAGARSDSARRLGSKVTEALIWNRSGNLPIDQSIWPSGARSTPKSRPQYDPAWEMPPENSTKANGSLRDLARRAIQICWRA